MNFNIKTGLITAGVALGLFSAGNKPVQADATPAPQTQTAADGTPVPKVWTPEFVREHIMLTDKAVAQKLQDGTYIPLNDYLATQSTSQGNTPDLQEQIKTGIKFTQDFDAISQRMEISPTPPIYVDLKNKYMESYAEASETVEGKKVVIINTAFIDEIKRNYEGAVSIVGHEDTHYLLKNTTAEGIAEGHNNPAKQRKAEEQCDLNGAGPLGSGHPEALANIFKEKRMQLLTDYMNINNVPTPTDDKSLATLRAEFKQWEMKKFPSHPPFEDRIALLDQEAAQMKAGLISNSTYLPARAPSSIPGKSTPER